MGGYVTTSRKTFGVSRGSFTQTAKNWYTGVDAGVIASGPAYPIDSIPFQVTTSYRSGGDLADETIFRGGTLGSSIQAIKTYDRELGTQWDNGHTFNTVDYALTFGDPRATFVSKVQSSSLQHTYRGPAYLTVTGMGYPQVPDATDLNFLGTQAINRTTPGNSPADVAQALIELKREGLPRLFGAASLRNRTRIARSAGEEYLNAEFGWKPLVDDLVDTMYSASESERMLNRLVQGSGGHIRRRMDFDPVITNTYSSGTGAHVLLHLPGSTIGEHDGWNDKFKGKWTIHERTTRKSWFSGAFTYHVPPEILENSFRGANERAKYLFGLELTPELVWNVAPWSWLADWFTNTGDVISNLQTFQADSTVLRYGYIMSQTEKEVTVSLRPFPANNGSVPGIVTSVYRTRRKQRIRATPYGFGLNPNSFTGRQWAILGALGMTRGNRAMRHSE